ncbi:MAG: cyclic peptide export ABC transporter [Verrucomicrobiae bacterium]|nr:cyclic peptide export ABC transporter [Verrucomicrobiae bacterium]
MEFFQLLRKESKDFDRHLLVAGAFAGIVSTLLIFILTDAANKIAANKTAWTELIFVVICIAAFWFSKGCLLRRTAGAVEEMILNMRLRIAGKIRQTDLSSFEGISRAAIFNAVSTHTMTISRAAPAIVSAGTSMVLLVCAFLVLYFLSPTAFLILAGALAFIIAVLFSNRGKIMQALDEVTDYDNRFVKGFGDLLDGFKELKMNSAMSRDFFESHLQPAAEASRAIRVYGNLIVNHSVLMASSALFILLGAVVFLTPFFAPADAPKLVRISTLIVFIIGPLGEVVHVYSLFTEATASIREIYRIEAQLDSVFEAGFGDSLPAAGADTALTFTRIRCEKISFSYRDEKGEPSFSLEPFDFHLGRPELVFITGGNGSGKSTFLKILAGLYLPAEGAIFAGDTVIGPHNRQDYRDLFAPIFSDFHLFDHLYGLKEIDDNKLQSLLHTTGLLGKTDVVERRISTLNLSTGQRKRLALVLAIMEDKPILLLDEWAAEQDPQFRRKFYREILPELKKQGKTVVAVTHDDDHYDAADRVLKMQYGKFLPV